MILKKKKFKPSKKILFTYPSIYPHIGGLSTHMELMSKGLKNTGFDVDIISYSSLPRILQILLVFGPIYFLDRLYLGFGSIYYYYYISKFYFNGMYLYKFVTKEYDLINAHHIFSLPSQKLVKKFKIPVILTIHTYFTYELLSRGRLNESSNLVRTALKHEKKAYGLASHIITVDTRLKEYLIDCGVNYRKIDVMFNPVDTDDFKPRNNKNKYKKMFNIPTNKKVLFCPRRLEKKNGVIYPVLTFLKLNRDDLILVYAGDGQEKDKIENLIIKNDLKEKVLLLGSVDHENMKFLYNTADIVLIPSIHSDGLEEATSISALEAMASGVPVIASDIGGLSDIIDDNINGLLVPDKNVEALEKAILRLLDDLTLYEKISKNSVKSAIESFSYISRTKFLLEILKNIT